MGRVDNDGEISEEFVRNVPGNAPLEIKALVQWYLFVFKKHGFGMRSVQGLDLAEVSIGPKVEEPTRREARVVLEVIVTEDMVNSAGKMDGACIVHLVDICTTLPITAMTFANGEEGSAGVSQNINVIYHAPASLGDKLRLINTSTTIGARTWSGRIEIWDVTHRRLVASATQIKMGASPAKL